MSLQLRPKGKPCLRSLRGTLMVVAGVVAFAAAPAATAQTEYLKPLGWYAEPGAAPETVDFNDVAAQGDDVIAVGRDGGLETGAAAIYVRAGEAWAPATFERALAVPSDLTDVAVHGTEAWAVGSEAGGPLVVRLVNGVWLTQTTPLTKPATSVAINGSKVLIGDVDGKIHILDTGGAAPTTEEPLAAGAVNDLALTGTTTGFAVAGFEEALPGPSPFLGDNSVRIYELNPDPQPDPGAEAASARVDMLSVASTSPLAAVATDSTEATWHFNGQEWVQDAALPAEELGGVAELAEVDTNGPTGFVWEALAGSVVAGEDPAASGAIWGRYRWRSHDVTWERQAVPDGTKPLTSVALTAPDAGWAVGEGGTVLRYWRPPDPDAQAAAERAAADKAAADQAAAEQAAADQAAAEQAEADRLAAEQAAADQAEAERLAAEQAAAQQQEPPPAEDPPAEQSTAPPPPPPVEQDDIRTNGIVIDDSTEPRRDTVRRQRLLKDVKAIRRGRKLIVSFRLTARARVAITAKRGRRVVARAPMRTLRKGRRAIVLRFRGKPPTSLKVVVRRAARATNSNR